MMQLACVAASTDRGVQLYRDAWPINAHYRLDTRYAPRVLHFSAFHYVLQSLHADVLHFLLAVLILQISRQHDIM